MNRGAVVISTTLSILAAGALPAQTGNKNRSHLGKVLPDIDDQGGTWINSTKGVSLEDLRDGPTLACHTFLG